MARTNMLTGVVLDLQPPPGLRKSPTLVGDIDGIF